MVERIGAAGDEGNGGADAEKRSRNTHLLTLKTSPPRAPTEPNPLNWIFSSIGRRDSAKSSGFLRTPPTMSLTTIRALPPAREPPPLHAAITRADQLPPELREKYEAHKTRGKHPL
jgi:hypothetical protein